MKKRPPWNENAAIRGALRRVFARSPVVREVMMEGRREVPKYNKDGTRSKKDAVQYHCQVCIEWVSSTKIAVDHIEPVVSVEISFVDWNEYKRRLFCDKSNLQRICSTCHDAKTNEEKTRRLVIKDVALYDSFITQWEPRSVEAEKAFVKKFTRKRLAKYPYPQRLIDGINSIKRRLGMKV